MKIVYQLGERITFHTYLTKSNGVAKSNEDVRVKAINLKTKTFFTFNAIMQESQDVDGLYSYDTDNNFTEQTNLLVIIEVRSGFRWPVSSSYIVEISDSKKFAEEVDINDGVAF